MSSSSSPCAACKLLRRKCTQGCVFAPYFPPDQPSKFANVHKVFGASNVSKLLNELPVPQREDAVNSLAYEAEARLRDPVYGCVAYISILQLRIKEVREEIQNARKELAGYIGQAAFSPIVHAGAGAMPHHAALGGAAQYAAMGLHRTRTSSSRWPFSSSRSSTSSSTSSRSSTRSTPPRWPREARASTSTSRT